MDINLEVTSGVISLSKLRILVTIRIGGIRISGLDLDKALVPHQFWMVVHSL